MQDTFANERLERTRALPNGQRILDAGYLLAGFGVHRDSGVLDESNYAVALHTLADAAGVTPADLGRPWADDASNSDPVAVAHFRHWAVGWVDELMVRADRPDLLAVADGLLARLGDYPILDEWDYSEREWANNHPEADELCYSDDPDCGCGRERFDS